MQDAIATLLRGPDRIGSALSWRRLFAGAPIVLFALIAVAFGASALAAISPITLLQPLEVAAAATLICLGAGLPASLCGVRLPWQLPLWLLLCAAPAAWARRAVPVEGPMVQAAIGAATLLPVMVLCLRGRLAAIPARAGRGAACAGAGRIARLLHVWVPLAWPAALRASLVVFLLALVQRWVLLAWPGAQ